MSQKNVIWVWLSTQIGEIQDTALWYSKEIKVSIPLNKNRMIAKGIIQIKHIYNVVEKRLMTANELQLRYNFTNFLVWNSILLAIPRHWKRILGVDKPATAEISEIFQEVASTMKCEHTSLWN